MKVTALIVDEEIEFLKLLQVNLESMGVHVVKAKTIKSAKETLHKRKINLFLTNLNLQGEGDTDIISYASKLPNPPLTTVITELGEVESAIYALKAGANDYISKPIKIEQIKKIVDNAKNKREKNTVFLGETDCVKDVMEMVNKVSKTQAPVHIQGETGTGKELIARIIHEASPRAKYPFIAVNCGAIPADLIESEFFGHKKGSFTGAIVDYQGLFMASQHGSLFLDEIGELSLSMQIKLLRALQEKRVKAVGGTEEIPVDIRLISATNQDLKKLISEKKLREDFYYRINVLPIYIPPLRKRKEDIPILTKHIISKISAANNDEETEIKINDDAISKIKRHHFPGNVRELENIIERAFVLSEGKDITAGHIVFETKKNSNLDKIKETDKDFGHYLQDVEVNMIREELKKNMGILSETARVLGITTRSLRYKVKKYNINID